jgi:hypothetical protein
LGRRGSVPPLWYVQLKLKPVPLTVEPLPLTDRPSAASVPVKLPPNPNPHWPEYVKLAVVLSAEVVPL